MCTNGLEIDHETKACWLYSARGASRKLAKKLGTQASTFDPDAVILSIQTSSSASVAHV